MDWTSHFATLYRDFLAASPTNSGIASNLPKKTLEDTAKLKRPFIVVEADPKESSRTQEWKGLVNIRLGIKMKEDGTEAAEAATLLGAIRDRLNDEDAWLAFIQAKTVLERTGWMILFRSVLATEHSDDESDRTRDYTISVKLHAITKR